MNEPVPETRFLGQSKAKIWTYAILGIALVVGILIANFAIKNPEIASNGVDAFMGLPGWAFPTITALLGIVVYYVGLKIEADWPEVAGSFMIAGSFVTAELMIGWEKFEFGGIAVFPFLLPIALFLGLVVYGIMKSR